MNNRHIPELNNRYIPDDVTVVERNGRIWFMHPFRRYDPVTLTLLVVGGIGLQVASTIQQGKDAEKIAAARAQVDIDDAKAVREQSIEEARIKQKKGRRLLATQKSLAAAGGIRINVGSPLVIEAETKDNIARDVGFILERGRTGQRSLLQSAAIEKAIGKSKKRASVFDAIGQSLVGVGSIAFMGSRIPGAGSGAGSGVKSFFGGGGQLSSGPTTLFDFNAGSPGLPAGGGLFT